MKTRKQGRAGKDFFAHPLAVVESRSIGSGTRVWAFSHVMAGTRIGKNCNIGEHVFVEKGARIGDRVTVKNGVQVWDGVTLKDDVFVGPNAAFTNDRYPRSPRSAAAGDRYESRGWIERTLVEEGASIGANATIMCGVRIGKYAVVGAGSVVTEPVKPFNIVVGVPASYRGQACACGRSLGEVTDSAVCGNCGRSYLFSKGRLTFRKAGGKRRAGRGKR